MIFKFGHKDGFIIKILLLFIIDATILLDVPIIRQIIGFLFLTILPGLLILKILKLNLLDFTEKAVLSIGLSISFLLVSGLLFNNSMLYFGYNTPLSTVPLLLLFNIVFIAFAIIGCKIDAGFILSLPEVNLTIPEKKNLIVPFFFPALSVFGMFIMNMTNNNLILMFMLLLIPTFIVFVCFYNQKFPKRLYPIVIFLISISLLLMLPLRSDHIIGSDTHLEYYFFRTTLNNMHWSVFGQTTLDATLSISLLPTIYQSILNLTPEFLFKILYSLLYSISPLVIYVLSKKYVKELYAFLVSIFFIFQSNFLMTEANSRTNIAILFYALSMMVLFNDKINPLKKKMLFIVFLVSTILSHYSTTYIVFFIVLGIFVGVKLLSQKHTTKKISSTLIILFVALIFFWYSQITVSAFYSGIGFFKNTIFELKNFFLEESRSSNVSSLAGIGILDKGIPHIIQFVFTWLTFIFIFIGIFTFIIRFKEMSSYELNIKKPEFLREKFEIEYFIAILVCGGLLFATVAIPFISRGYGIDRLYGVVIILIGIFFVIGGIVFSKYVKISPLILILFVLIPYFLSVSGFMYNLFGVPRAITLNSEGEQYDIMYVHDQEIYAAKWLKNNTDEKAKIFADWYGTDRLISQGMIRSPIYAKSFIENKQGIKDGYIYLRYTGVVNAKLLDQKYQWHNITEYSHLFFGKDLIYNNGGSLVFK